VVEQQPYLAVAGQPRRFDEAGIAQYAGLGTGDPDIKRQVDDGRGDDDVGHGVAERGDDAHGQHEQRKGHDGVGQAADDAVGPAAEEAGEGSGQSAEDAGDADRGDGDAEVEAGGDDDAREDVAAQRVGAEPVGQRRR